MKLSLTKKILPGGRAAEPKTDDELIAELDRRLAAQGFDPDVAGVKVVVDYLREGWSVVALPPEMADQFDGVPGVGGSIHKLSADLRQRLAAISAQVPLCDGCERSRPGAIAVGEEVLCADCILARATEREKDLETIPWPSVPDDVAGTAAAAPWISGRDSAISALLGYLLALDRGEVPTEAQRIAGAAAKESAEALTKDEQ